MDKPFFFASAPFVGPRPQGPRFDGLSQGLQGGSSATALPIGRLPIAGVMTNCFMSLTFLSAGSFDRRRAPLRRERGHIV